MREGTAGSRSVGAERGLHGESSAEAASGKREGAPAEGSREGPGSQSSCGEERGQWWEVGGEGEEGSGVASAGMGLGCLDDVGEPLVGWAGISPTQNGSRFFLGDYEATTWLPWGESG